MINAQIYSSNNSLVYIVTLEKFETMMQAGEYKVIVTKNKPIRLFHNGVQCLNKMSKNVIEFTKQSLLN